MGDDHNSPHFGSGGGGGIKDWQTMQRASHLDNRDVHVLTCRAACCRMRAHTPTCPGHTNLSLLLLSDWARDLEAWRRLLLRWCRLRLLCLLWLRCP